MICKKVTRVIFSLIFIALLLKAEKCADQYNPKNFLDAPDRVGEIIDNGLKNLPLFGDGAVYKVLGFEKVKIDDKVYYIDKKFIKKVGDYIYPLKSGLWRYHLDKNGQVDEFDIADVFEYKDSLESVASEVNSDFEGLWSRWGGEAYAHKLYPDDAQLRYGDNYLTLNVYIYGVKDDATTLKNSTVDYRFLNYTNEVSNYTKCKEGK